MKELAIILGGGIIWLGFIMLGIFVLYWVLFSMTAKDRIPGNHE